MGMNRNVLKAANDSELLSYIINVTPELQGEIDLPVQGESIAPIGKIIVNNQRYRNAFINTVNLIGLTVIKRNGWENPWNFTKRGTLRFGQQIRELVLDLCNVYDYNSNFSNKTRFLQTEVPNVFNYIHEVNFQKFYQTTTSDSQLAMAFDSEGGLFRFIDESISMLYESLMYDSYLVDKYQLCRRILDGTVTSINIPNYASKTAREIVSFMKNYSNKLTFRSPNYNPAGIRRATSYNDQILIANTEFDSTVSTEVYATSYFKNEADFKTNMAIIDSFSDTDTARLSELLGDSYVPFTSDDITALGTIPAAIISREWYMDYDYALDNESGLKEDEFYNPTTLENNHYLHAWRVFSTSPFENAIVFTTATPAVTSIAITPSTATVTKGQSLPLKAVVTTTGFANKAATYSVDDTSAADGVKIDAISGVLSIPATATVESVTVTATSVYDTTKTATSTITVASGTVPSITSVTVTAAGSANSIAASATLQMSATVVKTGNASTSVEWSVDDDAATDGFTISASGLLTAPAEVTVDGVTVTATSVFDTTKKGTKALTIGNSKSR